MCMCCVRSCRGAAPREQTAGAFKLWSDPATWPSGAVPVAGARVVIPATLSVLLDVSPPALGHLIIEGRLWFQDTADLTLTADGIVVFGELQVGTAEAPFTHTAVIALNGVRTSPTVVVDNAYFLGNKVLAVFGRVSLAGLPRAVTWTRLAAAAPAGATNLTLAEPVDWGVGDEVAITPTEYDNAQVEAVVVAAVSPDGRTIALRTPLAFAHGAQVVPVASRPAGVTLAAAVGLLSRSVQVRGNNVNEATPNYGAHVTVGSLARGVTTSRGRLTASHVRFDRVGQQGMEHPGLLFRYDTEPAAVGPPPVSSLVGCAVTHALNDGVVAEGLPGLVLRDNVFYRSQGSAVVVDDAVSEARGWCGAQHSLWWPRAAAGLSARAHGPACGA
jgi:hypothetical protein